VNINGLDFKQTCAESPEQYDVFKDGRQVGWVRLRHGELIVRAPDSNGMAIYGTEQQRGDGCFDGDERYEWLERCADEINETLDLEDDQS